MKHIYLDYAATTPVDPEVVKAMTPFWNEKFGNASSIHSFGREARLAIDEARRFLAFYLDCQPAEIIFTSGGSESDNLAIRGVITNVISTESSSGEIHSTGSGQVYSIDLSASPPAGGSARDDNTMAKPHVVTSQIEHHAVLNTIKDLEKHGVVEASYLKPNKEGTISSKQVKAAIKDNTVLVSIMYVNNEVGTVQPIREIGKVIERENASRQSSVVSHQSRNNDQRPAIDCQRIYFHTDAVQAAEYFEMGTKYLKVDLLTMTGHKIYGPKGVGLLFIKRGTPIDPQITGGEQEYRKRAGTENVAGVVGLAKAVELIIKEKADSEIHDKLPGMPELFPSKEAIRLVKLRDKLIEGLLSNIPHSRINGSLVRRTPANVNLTVENAEGEALLLNLDMEGIAASSGSACTSGALEPSHVLLAIGVPAEKAHGSVRFTLGRQTTEEDIDKVLEIFPKIVKKVRNISPFK